MKETDLFEPIKKYFLNRECEVFSEVLGPHGSNRADIVVRQQNLITVVEMKTTLSLDLLEQADRWLPCAHRVYIATPKPKTWHVNGYVEKCLKRDGIGLLQVDFFQDKWYAQEPIILERVKPKIHRKIINRWDKLLTEGHKNSIPGGSKGGGYITPYKTTIDSVKRCLRLKKNGASLDDIVKVVDTHYSNPKQGLYQALTKWEIDWCESFIVDRKIHFKIKEGVKI